MSRLSTNNFFNPPPPNIKFSSSLLVGYEKLNWAIIFDLVVYIIKTEFPMLIKPKKMYIIIMINEKYFDIGLS